MIQQTYMYTIAGSKSEKKIPANEIKDAIDLAKARVQFYRSIGWTCYDKEDLLSAAYLGISEAVIRYEPSVGSIKPTKFTSYAYPWINKFIRDFITNNKTVVSGSTTDAYVGKIGYAIHIDAFDDRNAEASGSDHKLWLTSEDANGYEKLEQVDKQYQIQELIELICRELPDFEKTVILLHFGIGTVNRQTCTNTEIAKALERPVEYIELILNDAISKFNDLKIKYSNMFYMIYE